MLYRGLKSLAIFLCKIFFRIEVIGKDKIPRNKAFILTSNHLSYLDPILLGVASPQKLYFLAKEELFRNKLFALFIKALGAVPLKRDRPDVGAMKSALKLLRNGGSLVIFPQGRRGNVGQAKAGVGFLFKKTLAPVVVARIFGTGEALPKGKKFIKFKKIKIIFDRVYNLHYTDTYETISEKVLDKIKSLV